MPEAGLAALPGHLHPVVRRVLAARQVPPAELEPVLAKLIPVSELPGIGPAVDRLARARRGDERVLVLGDFDADGATATALCITCLRVFGFREPAYLVPNRFEYGYGLSPAIAELAAKSAPAVLMTVDNGITSLEGVRRAAELSMEVLVTDHHLAGPELPAPALLVGPNLPGLAFASPALCGVGVAFYLMAALGRRLADEGLVDAAESRAAVADCLDLVALGTVADLVPLDFNNRILVEEGLRRIRAGRHRPGIAALFQVANREAGTARAADLGFSIAPRLNAAGRLTDMGVGIECLLAPDAGRAAALAASLDALNSERRELQARMQGEAELHLEALAGGADGSEPVVCLFDERWHQGVVGLVANRLRELSGRPAVAFARAGEPGWLRGSARSVPGVHLRDAIAEAVDALAGVPVRFGGHAMAAGLSLPEEFLADFRGALGAAVARRRDPAAAGDILWTDGALDAGDFTLATADALGAAGPWGQGFPEPLFDNEFEVTGQRVMAGRHLRLDLREPGAGASLEAVAFGQPPLDLPPGRTVRLIYRLDANSFRGTRRLQLVVERVVCD